MNQSPDQSNQPDQPEGAPPSSPEGYRPPSVDPRVVAAQQKSYTLQAVLTLVLYFVMWVPGFIANVLFYQEAKKDEALAGQSLPGVGCLRIMFFVGIAGLVLSLLGVVLFGGALCAAAVSTR